MNFFAVRSEDQSLVQLAAEKVFRAYDGQTYHWKLKDSSSLWKIHFGVRAGVVGVEVDGRRCCVKLFYDARVLVCLRNRLGLAKARRAFLKGIQLQEREVACPAMIGYAVDQASGLALLVTELADGAERVDFWVEEHGADATLAVGLGHFIAHMHCSGVMHTDLSLRNILVCPQEPGYHFLLLDYEDVRVRKRLKKSDRLENLHHMNERTLKLVPLKWRLTFLKEYIQNDSLRGWVDELNGLLKKYPSKYTAT